MPTRVAEHRGHRELAVLLVLKQWCDHRRPALLEYKQWHTEVAA